MEVADSNLEQILPLPLGPTTIGSTVEVDYIIAGGCTWSSFDQQRGWLEEGTAGIGAQQMADKEHSLRGCRRDFLKGYSLGFQEACIHLAASYLVA